MVRDINSCLESRLFVVQHHSFLLLIDFVCLEVSSSIVYPHHTFKQHNYYYTIILFFAPIQIIIIFSICIMNQILIKSFPMHALHLQWPPRTHMPLPLLVHHQLRSAASSLEFASSSTPRSFVRKILRLVAAISCSYQQPHPRTTTTTTTLTKLARRCRIQRC